MVERLRRWFEWSTWPKPRAVKATLPEVEEEDAAAAPSPEEDEPRCDLCHAPFGCCDCNTADDPAWEDEIRRAWDD